MRYVRYFWVLKVLKGTLGYFRFFRFFWYFRVLWGTLGYFKVLLGSLDRLKGSKEGREEREGGEVRKEGR